MTEITSAIREIKRQIPEISLEELDKPNHRLDNLIDETELTGKNPERTSKFKQLVNKVKWMGTAPELIWMLDGESNLKPKNPFILGLSNVNNATEALGVCLEGKGWLASSIKLGVRPDDPNHTQIFLRKLVDTNRDVVLVVPPDLYTHPKAKNTRSEMDWWLEHPESAENLYLVFGGVGLINKKWLERNTSKFKTPKGLIQHMAKDIRKLRKIVQNKN